MPATLSDGRYVLGPLLGRGPLGEVRVARDALLRRPVALKVLHPWIAEDPVCASRFELGCRTASRLDHPGLARVLDLGWDADGRPFCATELVDGPALAPGAGLPTGPGWAQAASTLRAALRHAHAHGVVHGAIKPSNVVLGPGPRARLTDLAIDHDGTARPEDDVAALEALLALPPSAVHPPAVTAVHDPATLVLPPATRVAAAPPPPARRRRPRGTGRGVAVAGLLVLAGSAVALAATGPEPRAAAPVHEQDAAGAPARTTATTRAPAATTVQATPTPTPTPRATPPAPPVPPAGAPVPPQPPA